ESLQTFGGSGFTMDWPLEQYVRDAKIDTLYEGTTAIQGLDFFFRKIIKDNGRALTKLSKEIGAFAASGGNNATEKAELAKALGYLNGAPTTSSKKPRKTRRNLQMWT
ncbi:MAG: acyl-CoA dehydrogenase family protein, partial [Candidatus Nanopelagicaceae bacterium]